MLYELIGQLSDIYLTPNKCHNPALLYLQRKIENN